MRHEELDSRPILNGIGPFSPNYEGLWYQESMVCEVRRKAAQAELDELVAKHDEWQLGVTWLPVGPIHREALWKCRAGTAVPLCFSTADHRPSGDPILAPSMTGVTCPTCARLGR